jgi:hypothetical protein
VDSILLHSVEGDEQYEGQSKAECCPYLRQVAATVGQMSQYAAAEPVIGYFLPVFGKE